MNEEKIKILLFGYINVNVMDGSAVFMSGLTSMLASSPGIEVDLVLANPLKRDILIGPLLSLENVNIISPYEDEILTKNNPQWVKKERMTHREAGEMLQYYWNKKEYDWLFIRGLEVVESLLDINEHLLKSTMVYMTGITNENQVITTDKYNKIVEIFHKSAYIVCQTMEMKQFLEKKFNKRVNAEIITLNPMIPDTFMDFDQVFVEKEKYDQLCYTGKFDVNWNSIPIIVAFRELLEHYPETQLKIAGDKFNVNKELPHFIEDTKYLLENTKNLTWYGAVKRDEARELIISTDIGITWRHKDMDSSLELSTKLLEYGSLGKAVILNPTKMHMKIFGDDYPLYADSYEDFLAVVSKVIEDPTLYKKAAKRMFEASKMFTYTETLKKLLPYLYKNKQNLIQSFFTKNSIKAPIKYIDILNDVNNTPILLNVKRVGSNLPFKCLIYKGLSFKEIHKVLLETNKYGLIKDIQQIGNLVFLLVNVNKKNVLENYDLNMNNEDVVKILEKALSKKVASQLKVHQAVIPPKQTTTSPNIEKEKSSGVNDKKPKVPSKIISLQKEMNSLNNLVKKQKVELQTIRNKYKALSRSKMGRITLKYWDLRKKVRS